MRTREYRQFVIGVGIILMAASFMPIAHFFAWLLGVSNQLIEQGGWLVHVRAMVWGLLSVATGASTYLIWVKLTAKLLQILGINPWSNK
jgi:hypothetical protein